MELCNVCIYNNTSVCDSSCIIRHEAEKHFRDYGDQLRLNDGKDVHASFDILRGPLTRYVYNRVGRNWMDAEDIVQNAYVKTLETAKINEAFNFAGIYKIWLDRCIGILLRERRVLSDVIVEDIENLNVEGGSLVDLAENNDANPEFLMDLQGKVDKIMRLSNRLRHKDKAVVRLVTIFGYTYKEVAQMLDIDRKKVDNIVMLFRKSFD